MDTAVKRAYIEVRLAKARDDLLTAQDDLEHGHWRGATNHAYYAVFHVASAALLWIDIERARHSGTQAAFIEFLVRPGKIEPEFGQIYTRARKAREEQDYDLMAAPLTREDAARIVSDAERFLARIERYLQETGARP
jgi:uncharacterized protein (UPF0332 family)